MYSKMVAKTSCASVGGGNTTTVILRNNIEQAINEKHSNMISVEEYNPKIRRE